MCGLQVLAFPCNQFGFQEPGANATEIFNGLKYVRPGKGFVPNFPMFKKRDVNGKDEDEIYTFFKSRCPSPDEQISELKSITWSPVRNNDISWNFEKILVDHMGHPVRRYKSSVEPQQITNDIVALIRNCQDAMKAGDSQRIIHWL